MISRRQPIAVAAGPAFASHAGVQSTWPEHHALGAGTGGIGMP